MYESEPEPELAGGRSYLPRGKVLGGTGSINGMIYVRGQREDFDGWRQLGNSGWSYDDVLPYFKKSEDNVRGADAYHATGGPIRVEYTRRHELADAFVEAAVQAGFPRNDDVNGASADGFGYNQVTIRGGRRSGTAPSTWPAPAAQTRHTEPLASALRVPRWAAVESRSAEWSLGACRRAGDHLAAERALKQLLRRPVGRRICSEARIPVLRSCGRPELGDHSVDDGLAAAPPGPVNDVVNNQLRRMAGGSSTVLFRKD